MFHVGQHESILIIWNVFEKSSKQQIFSIIFMIFQNTNIAGTIDALKMFAERRSEAFKA